MRKNQTHDLCEPKASYILQRKNEEPMQNIRRRETRSFLSKDSNSTLKKKAISKPSPKAKIPPKTKGKKKQPAKKSSRKTLKKKSSVGKSLLKGEETLASHMTPTILVSFISKFHRKKMGGGEGNFPPEGMRFEGEEQNDKEEEQHSTQAQQEQILKEKKENQKIIVKKFLLNRSISENPVPIDMKKSSAQRFLSIIQKISNGLQNY